MTLMISLRPSRQGEVQCAQQLTIGPRMLLQSIYLGAGDVPHVKVYSGEFIAEDSPGIAVGFWQGNGPVDRAEWHPFTVAHRTRPHVSVRKVAL